jgi:hypothetical protein
MTGRSSRSHKRSWTPKVSYKWVRQMRQIYGDPSLELQVAKTKPRQEIVHAKTIS